MSDPLTPPAPIVAKELLKAARTVERLKARRRAIVKTLDELDAELATASRFFRDLAASVTAIPATPALEGARAAVDAATAGDGVSEL